MRRDCIILYDHMGHPPEKSLMWAEEQERDGAEEKEGDEQQEVSGKDKTERKLVTT